MGRVIEAFAQFLDGAGDPLAYGWLSFLESGTNNTNKNTFADSVFQIVNANPLRLDGEGRCPDVFGTGDYRVVSFENDPNDETTPGEQVQLFDPVTAQGTLTTGGAGGSFDEWNPLTTYALGDIVTYNQNYYRSLIADNTGNNPAVETSLWEQIDFIRFWNDSISYEINDLVRYGNDLYFSLQSSNLNNQPNISPTYWKSTARDIVLTSVKTTDYLILEADERNLIILGSATATDREFTLPALVAANDNYTVYLYNDSDYNLTVTAQGVNELWLTGAGGSIILQKGSLMSLRYSADLDTFTPIDNVGPVLGNQIIGESSNPVVELISTLVTSANAVITALRAPVGAVHYFGNSDEGSIYHDGSDLVITENSQVTFQINALNAFQIGTVYLRCLKDVLVPTGYQYLAGDSNELRMFYSTNAFLGTYNSSGLSFVTNAINRWVVDSAGQYVPATTDAYDLGATSNRVRNLYMKDRIYFGTLQHAQMYHNNADLYIINSTGTINILNNDTDTYVQGREVILKTSSSLREWQVKTDGDLIPGGSNIQDIGQAGNEVSNLHVRNIFGLAGTFYISSSILPGNPALDLGSVALPWDVVYCDSVNIEGSTISWNGTDNAIELNGATNNGMVEFTFKEPTSPFNTFTVRFDSIVYLGLLPDVPDRLDITVNGTAYSMLIYQRP